MRVTSSDDDGDGRWPREKSDDDDEEDDVADENDDEADDVGVDEGVLFQNESGWEEPNANEKLRKIFGQFEGSLS